MTAHDATPTVSRVGWRTFIRADRDPGMAFLWLYRYVDDGFAVEVHAPDGTRHRSPVNAELPQTWATRLPDDSIVALRDEVMRVAGESPTQQVVDQLRADLEHERARVDRVLEAATRPYVLGPDGGMRTFGDDGEPT